MTAVVFLQLFCYNKQKLDLRGDTMNQDKTIMNQDKTIILACSSLTEYVEAAQARAGTKMQVRYLNRIYHRDPAEMQEHIKAQSGNKDAGQIP